MSSPDDILAMTDGGQSASQGAATAAPVPPSLAPLTISALMVTKADLIVALRAYLPHLSDIEVLDDGERFLLHAGPHEPDSRENGAP